jgi:hypothetical protein
MLLFLDSAEPPRKTQNLWESPDHGASVKNVEPLGISRPRSIREKCGTFRNLQTAEPPGENAEPLHL